MPSDLSTGFPIACRDSRGGVFNAYFAQLEHKNTLAKSTPGLIDTFTLTTGNQFWKYGLVHATANYDEQPTTDRQTGTVFFRTIFNMILNKRQRAIRNELIALSQNHLMIILEDKSDGTLWLMGETIGAMMDTSASPSGTAMADRNGYELVFSAEEAEPMSEVDPSLLATLLLPAA